MNQNNPYFVFRCQAAKLLSKVMSSDSLLGIEKKDMDFLFLEVGAGSIPVVSRNVAQLVRVPQAGGRGFESHYRRLYAYIAQEVERRPFYVKVFSLRFQLWGSR